MKNMSLLLFLTAFVLIACNKAEKEWETAKSKNTIESYQDFLKNNPNSSLSAEAQAALEKVRYTPSKDILENCLRDAIRIGAPGGPVGKRWTILVAIKKIGEYDKVEGCLKVEGMGTIKVGNNEYYVIPKYFRVTTDGKGKWSAEYID